MKLRHIDYVFVINRILDLAFLHQVRVVLLEGVQLLLHQTHIPMLLNLFLSEHDLSDHYLLLIGALEVQSCLNASTLQQLLVFLNL